MLRNLSKLKVLVLITVLVVGFVGTTYGHCNTRQGPVAKDARKALKNNDFETVAIWITENEEAELKQKFEKALQVYNKGGESKELAKDYFMENTVRLHRLAEGMSYKGLKTIDEFPEDIQAAEKALDIKDSKPINDLLVKELKDKVDKWHKKTIEAKKHKDESVEAGRKYASTYVKYTVFVHKLYNAIQAGPPHGVGEK